MVSVASIAHVSSRDYFNVLPNYYLKQNVLAIIGAGIRTQHFLLPGESLACGNAVRYAPCFSFHTKKS